MRVRLLVLAALLLSVCLGSASQPPLEGKATSIAPHIDGVVDPAEWKDATRFEGLLDPDSGAPIDEGGEFLLTYDAKFFYFAARLRDRDPSQIQATEFRPNADLSGNDSVTISIDPFGHLDQFSSFSINPRGATNLSIAGGRAAKQEWLGEFMAAGRITNEGWEAEARIPWKVMRLPAAGASDVRFNVTRAFRRLQRTYTWAFVNGGRIENYGHWRGVQIPKPEPKQILVLPYFYGGYDSREGGVANGGIDMRTELTDRVDAVASINPDFRNIENQVLSLDHSYFARLASESRPFFLEGSQFFQTSYESPIFSSQMIDGFDVGVKTYGKVSDKTDVGVLETADLHHVNNVVANVRQRFTDTSALTLAYAGRDATDLSNDAWFLAWSQSTGPLTIYGQQAATRDSQAGRGDRTNIGAYYGNRGASWFIDATRITSNFLPRNGFAPEVDYMGSSIGMSQKRATTKWGLIETVYEFSGSYFTRIDGSKYRESIDLTTSTTWKDGTDLDMEFRAENILGYHDRTWMIDLEHPRGDAYRHWDANITGGEVAGANYLNRSLSVSYRPVSRLQIAGSVQSVDVTDTHSDQAIVSASYDLSREQSISGRIVARKEGTNGYLAFRRTGRGADYFVIAGDPNAERFRTSLIVKVAIPFQVGR